MIRSFKDLEVYKESYSLAIIVNKLCLKFPLYEKNDLASQARRASKSIPSNLAEGWAKRRFEKEFKKYIDNALGSCNEMEVHLNMARDLGYIEESLANKLIDRYIKLGGKLTNLRNNWKAF